MIRINNSLVGAVERKALAWLVRLMPQAVGPDHLTAFGILGAVVTLIGYVLTHWSPLFLWLASLGLAMHWFGDSLDGSLARFRRIERPRYGYFVDQTVDVIGNLLICGGIGLSAYVRLDVSLLALAGYHALAIYNLVKAGVTNEFNVALSGWGPTEIRLLIILMNTTIFFFGAPTLTLAGQSFTWCDVTVLLMAIGFFTVFVRLFTGYAAELAREEAGAGASGRAQP